MRFELREGDEELLLQLSAKHSAALLAKGSYEKRAASLGIARGTFKSQLHRARARLEELRKAPQETADPEKNMGPH
jgi:DNA-directed RNA polymerase specialized sigma24 family protein